MATGDVDRDGDVDAVVGNYNQLDQFYLNSGSVPDVFQGITGIEFSTDALITRHLVLHDIDADGDLDLLAAMENGPNRLYVNDGLGNLSSGVNITDDNDSSRFLVVGDVDRDGDADVIACNRYDDNRLYLNNGTNNPFDGVSGSSFLVSSGPTDGGVLGDVEGDGDLDLISVNQEARMYKNNGSLDPFASVTPVVIDTFGDCEGPVFLLDLDGDGDLDLIGHEDAEGVHSIVAYLNDGSANPFTQPNPDRQEIWHTGNPSPDFTLADLTKYGGFDCFLTDQEGNGNVKPSSVTPRASFAATKAVNLTDDTYDSRAVVHGDVNRDGRIDIIIGNRDQPNRLYLNNQTIDPFNGVVGSDITSDAHDTRSLALGDLDQDGDLDLVVGNFGGRSRIYLGDGSASPFNSTVGTDLDSVDLNTKGIAIYDMDLDGDLDVLTANEGQTNLFHRNLGGATFAAGIPISSDTFDTQSVAAGDVNRDGNPDVVFGNYGQTNMLVLGSGTLGPFDRAPSTPIYSYVNDTTAIALADFDRDGFLDVVTANHESHNHLYLGNGDGTFTAAGGLTIYRQNTLALTVTDADQDGDMDVLTANACGQPTRLSINTGSQPPFWQSRFIDFMTNGGDSTCLAAADFDRDGLLELVVGHSGTVPNEYIDQVPVYDTNQNIAVSLQVDGTSTDKVTLASTQDLSNHTWVDYLISNDGGAHYHHIRPNRQFIFPQTGTDLRWKAELHSLSPLLTPIIDQLILSPFVLIPDPNLKAHLVANYDTNLDTEIDVLEAQAATGTIDCSGLGILDLTGIEAFRFIYGLNCANNSIAEIPDIAHVTTLRVLIASYNTISTLGTSKTGRGRPRIPVEVEQVVLDHNELTNVPEISSLVSAAHINISHNRITFLPDMSALVNLEYFDASHNRLTDVSNLASPPNLGTQAHHFIAVDHNFLTVEDCPSILAMKQRTDVSGATFNYEIQIDLSLFRAQLPNWPIIPAIILDWIQGINDFTYTSTVECE